VLGRREKGRYSRIYCGGGRRGRQSPRRLLRGCRARLTGALVRAARTPASRLYQDEVCRKQSRQGDQACYDAVYFRPLGAITQPLIPWINRPTFQQAVEVQGHR
jgi:hypothetical protein